MLQLSADTQDISQLSTPVLVVGDGELQKGDSSRFADSEVLLERVDIERIQAGDKDAFRDVFTLFGCRIEDGPTYDTVKFYQFDDLLPKQEPDEPDQHYKDRAYVAAEAIVEEQLGRIGWHVGIFGPDRSGNGFLIPDLWKNGYDRKCVWVYQPYDPTSVGSLSPAYNLLWSVSHELAHAQTNDQLTEMFGGKGKRRGALGITTTGNTYSLSKAQLNPLSLADALRATEWEHHATLLQRNLIEKDLGIKVSDREFLGEYQYNIAGSVIRTLWGFFCTPGELGVVPQPGTLSPDHMNALAQNIYRIAARKMGLSTTERFESRSVNGSGNIDALLDSASAHRDGHH